MTFDKWIDTLIEEKGLDLEYMFEVNGPVYGMNMIPLEAVVEQIKVFHPDTKKMTKNRLVEIDFKNGDIMHFFKYIAKKMAM
tara:strand:+ start:120 stop:365 length:246 start_codon:yes stop_codon:yes gene_type:complete